MFAFIEGIIDEIQPDRVAIDCGGVGYELLVSAQSLQAIKPREKRRMYVSLIIRDDAVSLYGFVTKEEKSVFLRLITVSGVGPKVALSVLSTLTPAQIAMAIVSGDERTLTRAPGLGKKTAQRLILEFKGSLKNDEFVSVMLPASTAEDDQAVSDASAILMAMGFSPQDSAAAIALIKAEGGTAEQMAMNALRRLDRG